MEPIPSHLLRRALVVDVVLCLVMVVLSLHSGHQLWRLLWGAAALVCVLDALLASRLLGGRGD